MVEFDRTAAILSTLTRLDDRTTAELAGITFATDNDHGICHDLRETLAREYRNGNAEGRDWYRTAAIVAEHLTGDISGNGAGDVASRSEQFVRFAAVSDIATLRISTSPYDDEEMVIVEYGESLGDVVANALRLRFKRAAYQLMASLEDHADQQAHHHTGDVDVTKATSPVGGPPIY